MCLLRVSGFLLRRLGVRLGNGQSPRRDRRSRDSLRMPARVHNGWPVPGRPGQPAPLQTRSLFLACRPLFDFGLERIAMAAARTWYNWRSTEDISCRALFHWKFKIIIITMLE